MVPSETDLYGRLPRVEPTNIVLKRRPSAQISQDNPMLSSMHEIEPQSNK